MSMRRLALALLAGSVVAISAAGTAHGAQQIESFSVTSSSAQAGGHPDLSTSFTLADPGEPEAASDVIVNLPEGMFGNPNAVQRCTASDFALEQCPSNSQVGLITIRANYAGDPNFLLGTAPIYNVDPGQDVTVMFSFTAPVVNLPVTMPVAMRTGSDYGMRFTVSGISQLIPLAGADVIFWGFPLDESHDEQRFAKGSPGSPAGCPGLADTSCIVKGTQPSMPNRPLTQNPSHCTGTPLTATLTIHTYQDPGNPTQEQSSYPDTIECEVQTFNPVLRVDLTTEESDAPSGLDLELEAPQFFGFAASPSVIRHATVVLPPGLSINPDAADGQTSCVESQAGFGTELAGDCPDSSKIGTFSIESPALEGPLPGALYFGEPKPGDQYRIFMFADGFGIHAKLVGSVQPDPVTGQLTVRFTDLPQAPFAQFNVHLFASDRGLLATPTQCRLYEVDSVFHPWNEALPWQHSRSNLSISSGPAGKPCPGVVRSFNPRLVAGTSNPVAGDFSDFHLKLDRDDGDQFLGDLTFRMPPGFTGNLKGISYCSEGAILAATQRLGREEQALPSCPASSLIGTTNVAAGPGTHPFNAVGRMYLSGPLKGAPLSLAAVTPALAGPYDYGVVVVRVALHVDKQTAQVFAVSDRVPQIIGGVPIRMRSIQVNIDRPGFAINPTNCDPMSVDSQGIGDQGSVTDFSSYFHVVNCATLPFQPRMSVRRTGGRKAARRAQNPALQFDLRTRPGDANIRSIAVTLPRAFEIDQRHLGDICSERELVATECAGRTAIGRATTTTPLLDQPLSGAVYAVSGSGGLPRLAFLLNGQVNLVPRADTTSVKGLLRTTVPIVPDAPVGHFHLDIFGGKRGYLVNTRDLCPRPPRIAIAFTAHNGKTLSQRPRLRTRCRSPRK